MKDEEARDVRSPDRRRELLALNRRHALLAMGASAAGLLLPAVAARAQSACLLTPEETAGPYPLDLSANASYFRQDITEGRGGTPLELALTIIDAGGSCEPIENARVDVWHCDKDGVYSGYAQPGGVNTVGQTFMRGIQTTDAFGQVYFDTIYPGWYPGRITHVHFQVYVDDVLVSTSQLAFPQAITQAVYATALYGFRQNTSVTSFAQDNVFADGTADQMVTISGDTAAGFSASLVVGVECGTTICVPEPRIGAGAVAGALLFAAIERLRRRA